MDNYYFIYWMEKHGEKEFFNLSKKLAANIEMPEEIKGKISNEDYIIHYFWVVYCTVALNYFGLTNQQISFIMDLCMAMGTSKCFNPSIILETHKNIIPDLLKYIKKDFLDSYKGE